VASRCPADSPSECLATFRSAPARGQQRPPGSWRGLQGLERLRHRDQGHGAMVPAIVRVVDRWPFPHARLGLVLLRLKLHGPARGFPSSCARGRATYSLTLVTFASPSEMLSGSRGPSPFVHGRVRGRGPKASGSSPLDPDRIGTPLMGLSMIAPPSTCLPSVHSRSCPGSGEPPARLFPEGSWSAGFVHALRLEVATFRARSALAVPPGFGGLLRWAGRRFVAPCSRPWGSPRFRSWCSCLSAPPTRRGAVRPVTCTSGEVLSSAAASSLLVRSSEEALPCRRPEASGSREYRDHPRWRSTLRSFPLADSRSTSPWSLPSRHQVGGRPPCAADIPGGVPTRGGFFPRSLASRPCSIDESVAPDRRCRRPDARCFHGLPYPSKVSDS